MWTCGHASAHRYIGTKPKPVQIAVALCLSQCASATFVLRAVASSMACAERARAPPMGTIIEPSPVRGLLLLLLPQWPRPKRAHKREGALHHITASCSPAIHCLRGRARAGWAVAGAWCAEQKSLCATASAAPGPKLHHAACALASCCWLLQVKIGVSAAQVWN